MEKFSLNPNHCIVNLSNSILAHFGIKPFHPTLPELDQILTAKNYQNIVLVLYDGVGYNILNRNLPQSSILRTHTISKLSAVFPPTTIASTRSILTGKFPIETGWIGWDQYVSPIDKTVTMFRNVIKDTLEPAASFNVAQKYFPTTTILNLINQRTDIAAVAISPYDNDGSMPLLYKAASLPDFTKKLKKLCSTKGQKFIYAYIDVFDDASHRHGPDSAPAQKVLKDLESLTAKLVKNLQDTLLIITADHGHILTNYFLLSDYPDIVQILQRETSLEKRATSFSVQPEYLDTFPFLFKKHFSDQDFVLLTKQQVLDSQLFGPGTPHPLADSVIGDFVSISISDKAIAYDTRAHRNPSNHAGATPDETIVPLIVI